MADPMHPKSIGERTEAIVLAELAKRGLTVLMPFGNNQRYDFVIDVDGQFIRLQCKTGRLRNGVVKFSAASTRQRYDFVDRPRDYRGDADLFVVYCYETDAVYVVAVEDVGRSSGAFRVEPTGNNVAKGVRWAVDHHIDNWWPVQSHITLAS